MKFDRAHKISNNTKARLRRLAKEAIDAANQHQQTIHDKARAIIEDVPPGFPVYRRAELRGYWEGLFRARENELFIFGYTLPDGRIGVVRTRTPDYYGKLITLDEFFEANVGDTGRFFWRKTMLPATPSIAEYAAKEVANDHT